MIIFLIQFRMKEKIQYVSYFFGICDSEYKVVSYTSVKLSSDNKLKNWDTNKVSLVKW